MVVILLWMGRSVQWDYVAAKAMAGGILLIIGSIFWWWRGSSVGSGQWLVATLGFFSIGVVIVAIGIYAFCSKKQ